MQRIADRCASWLVPVALLIAIAAYVGTGNLVTAVTILVVFCPCALVLATPTAIMAAIGQATKHGVIVKSGEALEAMGKVDTIAFDKTGTLTYGRLDVSDVLCFDASLDEAQLRRWPPRRSPERASVGKGHCSLRPDPGTIPVPAPVRFQDARGHGHQRAGGGPVRAVREREIPGRERRDARRSGAGLPGPSARAGESLRPGSR